MRHRTVGLDAAHGVVVGGFTQSVCLSVLVAAENEVVQKGRKEGRCAGKRVRRGASHLYRTVVDCSGLQWTGQYLQRSP